MFPSRTPQLRCRRDHTRAKANHTCRTDSAVHVHAPLITRPVPQQHAAVPHAVAITLEPNLTRPAVRFPPFMSMRLSLRTMLPGRTPSSGCCRDHTTAGANDGVRPAVALPLATRGPCAALSRQHPCGIIVASRRYVTSLRHLVASSHCFRSLRYLLASPLLRPCVSTCRSISCMARYEIAGRAT